MATELETMSTVALMTDADSYIGTVLEVDLIRILRGRKAMF